MSELKWNWAYYPYLDPPEKQKESALKAGYIKVVNKSEADKVIESIIKGAMSMFRESNRCRGLDTKSPLGRIADVAFKHWMYVERMEARITEKDKEIAKLREFIENYRFDNKNMLHKIMNQDKKIRRLNRALYKACAMWADRTRLICSVFGSNAPKIRWERMLDKCRAMAERYMEGKA